ncbi:pH-response regulator protein palA/RIM20 [Colletotrichum liriopes]|uniref:PH-response regulator protein palA/RIM20 n=1 Tax=Colletotrichum liriopes TaxID=708192 RepID=A0AA37GSN1_9PEZI|nr:pH-response regulator protein palA/RIM20 [Colletotrichum liriopes]
MAMTRPDDEIQGHWTIYICVTLHVAVGIAMVEYSMSGDIEALKRNLSSGSREREQALQRLDNAYYKYKEIVNNADVGRKFYNDLSKVVGQKFRDTVKAWAAERRIDAKSLEE